MARAKVCASRKRTHTIMSGGGFGDLKVKQGGLTMIIPQKYVTKEGLVYKRVQNYISNLNLPKLDEIGVAIM